ncbi:glycosyltransferase family 2 protein [Enterococcus hailinensis]|uniref:glycosyltransferase family 2 protein n=1 Tax=Enterococcus hailinensis TaxID=3238988 RepID=UPI0038B3374D
MCEISIIVPVYNVENYLEKCINSLISQTIKDIEIILVDDGSTDKSGEICDKFAKIDSRIKVLHKKNGGLSDARNFGIDYAKGKYLGFIDSDDYVDRDMYEFLYSNIKNSGSDMSTCGIYNVHKGKDIQKLEHYSRVVNSKEAIDLVLDGNILVANAVNKLYKKDLFKEIRYPKGKVGEDAAVIFDILDSCNQVHIDTTQKYYYYHREGSITSKKFTKSDIDFIEIWEINESWINNKYPDLYNKAHTRLCWANFVVLDKLVFSKNKEFQKEKRNIRSFLTNNFLFIMKNKRLTKQRKLSMILLMCGLSFYKLPVILQYKKIKAVN